MKIEVVVGFTFVEREHTKGSSHKLYIHASIVYVCQLYNELCVTEICSRFGKIEGVKILPQRYPNIGVAAFIDFYSIQSAIDAKEAKHKISGCDIRTNFKSKPADSTQRKWQESPSIEKKEKQEKARGHERYQEREGMSLKIFQFVCVHIVTIGGVLSSLVAC